MLEAPYTCLWLLIPSRLPVGVLVFAFAFCISIFYLFFYLVILIFILFICILRIFNFMIKNQACIVRYKLADSISLSFVCCRNLLFRRSISSRDTLGTMMMMMTNIQFLKTKELLSLSIFIVLIRRPYFILHEPTKFKLCNILKYNKVLNQTIKYTYKFFFF